MKLLGFSIALMLLTSPLQAQTQAQAPKPVDLDSILKIDTVLYETRVFDRLHRAVETDLAAITRPATELTDAELAAFLQSRVESYLQAQAEERGTASASDHKDPAKFKQLEVVVHDAVIKTLHEIRAQGRKYGIGVAIAYGVISIAEYVLPVWMVAIGQPEIAAALLVFPSATVFLSAAVAVESAGTYLSKAKQYGGLKPYAANQRLHRMARKQLGMRGTRDVVAPLTGGDSALGVDLHNGTMTGVYGFLGMNRQALTFKNIQHFCKEHDVNSAELSALKKVKQSPEVKTYLATIWALRSLPSEQVIEFVSAFKSSFVFGLPRTEQDPALQAWALQAASVQSLDDLPGIFANVPAGAEADEIVHLYADFVLPQLIDTLPGLKFHRFRTLLKATWSLYSEVDQAAPSDGLWNAAWQQRLVAATSLK